MCRPDDVRSATATHRCQTSVSSWTTRVPTLPSSFSYSRTAHRFTPAPLCPPASYPVIRCPIRDTQHGGKQGSPTQLYGLFLYFPSLSQSTPLSTTPVPTQEHDCPRRAAGASPPQCAGGSRRRSPSEVAAAQAQRPGRACVERHSACTPIRCSIIRMPRILTGSIFIVGVSTRAIV